MATTEKEKKKTPWKSGTVTAIAAATFIYIAFVHDFEPEALEEARQAATLDTTPTPEPETEPLTEEAATEPDVESPEIETAPETDTEPLEAETAETPLDEDAPKETPTDTQEATPVEPEISPETLQMMEELGIPPELADHIREVDGKTFIFDNSGNPIAEIKKLSNVDGGSWAKNNLAGFDDRTYVLATVDGNKPFETASMLKAIGIDPTHDVIAYTDHISDNAKGGCWEHNELVKIEYGGTWACGTPLPEPCDVPVEQPPVQEVEQIPEIIDYENCTVHNVVHNGVVEHIRVTDASGKVIYEGSPRWYLDHPEAQPDNIVYRDGKFIDTNARQPVHHTEQRHHDGHRSDHRHNDTHRSHQGGHSRSRSHVSFDIQGDHWRARGRF